ncbi:unnamed protein product [Caenorhabditis auriculariae]|uniref:Uncharacterized protein n=1 Tax=Caenorhabditis auriculariae TaxID=2777116 RepID=A0A8S1HYS2_9PELO|nr:unnamed protein product [Caenorhabditis auriculariae]
MIYNLVVDLRVNVVRYANRIEVKHGLYIALHKSVGVVSLGEDGSLSPPRLNVEANYMVCCAVASSPYRAAGGYFIASGRGL